MDDHDTLRHGKSGVLTGRVTTTHPEAGDGDSDAIRLETARGVSGWVIFGPDCPGRNYQWETDHWYRLKDVVGCDSERALQNRAERVSDALSSIRGIDQLEEEVDPDVCPDCGGTIDLRYAMDLPQQIREKLETLSGRVHGIGRASLALDSLDTGADDWRPQPDQESRRRQRQDEPPTVVCLDCNMWVTDHYQERIVEQLEQSRIHDGAEREAMPGSVDTSVDGTAVAERVGSAPTADAAADVGMATGGAKDATNFRDNIHEGYVPQPDSLAYEGLFYDYYFDTGDTAGGDSLFYPSYSMAVTESPLSGEVERYMTVGLNSNLTEADLERKPLNLVAVVDVSGSMSSQFDQYYYDEHGNRREVTADADEQTKMAAARQALNALTEQLRDEDLLGVVLYNTGAHVAKPLRRVGETNMDAIRAHIKDISAGGGTDMSAGFSAAMDLLEPHHGADLTAVENRIVFMTDAMPNLGTTDRDDIVDEFDAAADENVHTTFVGIGLDTNADLVESISRVRGANHYFVHSTEEFKQRLANEFTYMVTPLVFDLSLDVVSDGYEIEAVYGSPNADRATGEVMHVRTLFPSPTAEGETRGGVTLLKLKETDPNATLELVADWVERDGTQDRDVATISFPSVTPDYFDNNGIRKAVLLSRYGRLLREWMVAIRQDTTASDQKNIDDWTHPDESELRQWEEQSVPLTVPESYQREFDTLGQHVAKEREQLGDDTLSQELDILNLLSDQTAIEETRATEPSG